MALMNRHEHLQIPARRGKAVRLAAGEMVRVINTHGAQVVDTWAFNADDLSEFMSMEHVRSDLRHIFPKVGDRLVTNQRRAILTIVEDTSPGIHDTLMSACDVYRYHALGVTGYHDNCTDNMVSALKDLGIDTSEVPSPFNLFMNVPVHAGGILTYEAPVSRPGDSVTLRAELTCIVAFSACPQDLLPINGIACVPTEADLEVIRLAPAS